MNCEERLVGKPLPNNINVANPWTKVPVYGIIGTAIRDTYFS